MTLTLERPHTQTGLEKILVWDETVKTIELNLLLQEHVPSEFRVEESLGYIGTHFDCSVMSDYDILPVLSENISINDLVAFKEGNRKAAAEDAKDRIVYCEGPRFLSDYSVILAKLTKENAGYVIPRVLRVFLFSPDLKFYFYADDLEGLKKSVEGEKDLSKILADYISQGWIIPKKALEDKIRDGTLIAEIGKHFKKYRSVTERKKLRAKRVLLVDRDLETLESYGAELKESGNYHLESCTSREKVATGMPYFGVVLINAQRAGSWFDWEMYAKRLATKASPTTTLVFYDEQGTKFKETFEQLKAKGINCYYMKKDEVPNWLKSDEFKKIMAFQTK